VEQLLKLSPDAPEARRLPDELRAWFNTFDQNV
jgi:hypothetical protein